MSAGASVFPILAVDVPLNKDLFLRTLIRHLSGAMEDIIGLKDASGYISVVGQMVGDQLNSEYKAALQVSELSREQVSQILVDLKRRIGGQFYVIEESDERIVFGNSACPFGDKVIGRRSMCMMTSNVFGAIAAQNLGYAKVELVETIAQGDPRCKVIVYLKKSPESGARQGREYFRT